jgi:hypothetical protein
MSISIEAYILWIPTCLDLLEYAFRCCPYIPLGVEDSLYFIFLYSIDYDWRGQSGLSASEEGFFWGWGQLDNRKDQVKASH